jgi:CRISPR-associated protein Cmr6
MTGSRPIPNDTAAVLTPKALVGCLNLGLLLDRLNPWECIGSNNWDLAFHVQERKKVQGQWQWQPATRTGGEAKGFWLSDQQDDRRTKLLDEPLLRRSHIDAALLKAHSARWERLVAHYGADVDSGLRFDLKTESRLMVGLGAESVLETAITLHRIYGFPVIPGSALKGLARTWALLELAATLGVPALGYEQFQAYKGPKVENKRQTPLNRLEALLEVNLDTEDQSQRKALRNDLNALQREQPVREVSGNILGMELEDFRNDHTVQEFRAVFGCLGQAGSAIFFDAIPVRVPQLVADVMNVHYPDYYRDENGKTPPSDDQNPNPVSFLAVAAGAAFRFAVGARRQSNLDDLTCARRARTWLEQALCEVGAGAKTSAGYGYWEEVAEERVRPDTVVSKPTDTEPEVPPGYQRGRVKNFGLGPEKSYGFIFPKAGGTEIFVHRSDLAEGVTFLEEGQEVIFKVVQTPKGPQAEDVRPLL